MSKYDNNFYDEKDLVECLNRGCEVKFLYNGKKYSITHTDKGISVIEFNNQASEKTYATSNAALMYEIDGKKLKDIIAKMKVATGRFKIGNLQ